VAIEWLGAYDQSGIGGSQTHSLIFLASIIAKVQMANWGAAPLPKQYMG